MNEVAKENTFNSIFYDSVCMFFVELVSFFVLSTLFSMIRRANILVITAQEDSLSTLFSMIHRNYCFSCLLFLELSTLFSMIRELRWPGGK